MVEYRILLRHCAEIIEAYRLAGIEKVPIESLCDRLKELQVEAEKFYQDAMESVS